MRNRGWLAWCMTLAFAVGAPLAADAAQEGIEQGHIASHGEFGGTPAQTFVLTLDDKLTMTGSTSTSACSNTATTRSIC